ncbi:response regulator [Egicoccus sp. AB-alg6-2]|uniref:response regulator transcription factor n=1 Tax=Egicoccus sp. AB-alg6-2 TaxID=3242692 RepID=UPI00359EE7EB
MIRLVLADDQELVREGLRTILGSEPDLEVVGEAADGDEAVRQARLLRPDLVVIDVRMPGTDGLQATRTLLEANGWRPRVLVLTTFDLDEYVFEALRAGASGFALKSAPRHQLVAAIRMAAEGDLALAPAVTRRLVERFGATEVRPTLPATLTVREAEVLELVARGLSNAEIAAHLHLATTTVKTHLSSLLLKLRVRDRIQLVITAYEHGIVAPGADRPDRSGRPS